MTPAWLTPETDAAPEGAAAIVEVDLEPPGLPLHADARGEHPSVVLQEAAVKAAILLGERHAGIEVEVPVDGVVYQEGALVEVAGAV